MSSGIEEYKQAQQRAWEAGDYREVAARIESAAHALVAAARVTTGQRVLDVATGSGSVAVAAARAGADVLGLDHTDAWFADARRRADAAGVTVDLRIGDAEALPVADGAFDVVLSSFGAIFAPRHDVVAAELVRACRPGGTVGLTAWTAGSPSTAMFTVLAGFLPDPPPFATPFIRWGDPDYLRSRFAENGVDLDITAAALVWEFSSLDAYEDFLLTNSGPFIAGRAALEEAGRWEVARAALRDSSRADNEATDGTVRYTLDYLVAVGDRPAA